jgi:hypothetical protein
MRDGNDRIEPGPQRTDDLGDLIASLEAHSLRTEGAIRHGFAKKRQRVRR